MNKINSGLVLEHSIGITIPVKVFDRTFTDFRDKHELNNRMVYGINSDGKFRLELKETAENDKEYLIRISGWKTKEKKSNIDMQKIYVAEPFPFYDYVLDFLDLIETWATDNKGSFYFKYIDFDEPLLDAYNVIKGLEKVIPYSDNDLQKLLHTYGYSDKTEK